MSHSLMLEEVKAKRPRITYADLYQVIIIFIRPYCKFMLPWIKKCNRRIIIIYLKQIYGVIHGIQIPMGSKFLFCLWLIIILLFYLLQLSNRSQLIISGLSKIFFWYNWILPPFVFKVVNCCWKNVLVYGQLLKIAA